LDNQAFLRADGREPHRDRTRAILQQHPEIRKLVGRNPFTAVAVVGLVGLQLGLSFIVRDQPWWVSVLLAYVVGAFIAHGLFVLMHDCGHNLIFKRRALNSLLGILSALPSLTPSAASFRRYHMKHHAFQGVYDLDGDLPSEWEARWVGNGTIRKAIWLLFFPLLMAFRPMRVREMKYLDGWTVANWIISLAFTAGVFVAFGFNAILYLFWSMAFSLGLHPVGARWIQEHYLFHPPQETYSYYGPMNVLAFNVGYHNEHHDFPAIPWSRLPKVREIAPEWYNGLAYHMSWLRLLARFLFDPGITLYSRVVRPDWRGKSLEGAPARQGA
jgi:sphingolipid delta-4 desaturase